MKTIAIHVDGEISYSELKEIFRAAGYAVRAVGTQIIVSRVPDWLRRDVHQSNVHRLPARPHIKRAAR